MRFSIFIFNVTIIYFAAKQPEALPKAGFRAVCYFPKVLNKFAKNVRWSCGEIVSNKVRKNHNTPIKAYA
ncbi:hypothetical protein, partial [uncultured Phascolarctobacterium sp.]|uniref:hypothetical protein n=1 Tax=uncultured Phascolarctobacterium sp. TaxID=512296 RepID=UPI0027D94E12